MAVIKYVMQGSDAQSGMPAIGLDVVDTQSQSIRPTIGLEHCFVSPVWLLQQQRNSRVELKPSVGERRGTQIAIKSIADTALQIDVPVGGTVTFGTKRSDGNQDKKSCYKQAVHIFFYQNSYYSKKKIYLCNSITKVQTFF